MRIDDILERGPGENGKLTVLRRDKRYGVSLIMHKLRGREMASAAKVGGIDSHIVNSLDGFRQQNLIDSMCTVTAQDLRSEREGLELIRDDGRPINGGQAGQGVYRRLERDRRGLGILWFALQESGKVGKRRNQGMRYRLNDGIPPLVRTLRHDQ